ncbi:MAG: fibronectin type III domain-containing protein [bacterium]|nr:MAG: fibronectin type III domain-containing protein [bacterium]
MSKYRKHLVFSFIVFILVSLWLLVSLRHEKLVYNFSGNGYTVHFGDNPTKSGSIVFRNELAELSFYTPKKQSFGVLNSPKAELGNNTLVYKDIYSDIDLKYSITPSRLLEEFIVYNLDTASKIEKIDQEVKTLGIDSYRENGGGIYFYQDQKLAFSLPAPVMYELNNKDEKSFGIVYEISQKDDDSYLIVKKLTKEGQDWINDSQRNYPIAIDIVIDNGDIALGWESSDATYTTVTQETSVVYEGSGSVKIQTTAEAGTSVELMEYSSDEIAQSAYGSNYITSNATGGTITSSGGYTIHKFTTSGTFVLARVADVDYLVVGGGGGGVSGTWGYPHGGGGGGGQALQNSSTLNANSYAISVGNGGAIASSGSVSSIAGVTSAVGGGGGNLYSGGTSGNGYAGGTGDANVSGGGGGASANGSRGGGTGGTGGAGITSSISGSSVQYAGGGGGSGGGGTGSRGIGVYGGGNGGESSGPGYAGAGNTGGGGGGGHWNSGGTGGSGIVIVRYLTPPYLQSYSESTIKTEGSYSLKGVANQTTSLNKTITKTFETPLDMSTSPSMSFDIRASRTGSNIKIGLRDTGGTTTEVTPNITSANEFQTVTMDLSGVSSSDKDSIDQLVITVVNADSENTFYVDNFQAGYGSKDDTVTLTKTATDLSGYNAIIFWVRSNIAGSFARFQFGESASNEQSFDFTINNVDTWEQKVWNISGINASSRDEVTKIALQLTENTNGATVYFDYILTNILPGVGSLDLPLDSAVDQSYLPVFKFTSIDPDGDDLRYRIQVCSNLSMTTGCQIFDQSDSMVGWSGQDAMDGTAYVSGTQATYTMQTQLSPLTTYYWRSYAIDPLGSNILSSTQGTPFSFTTHEGDAPSITSIDSVAGDTDSIYYDNTDDSATVIAFTSTDGGGGGVFSCNWDGEDLSFDQMGNICSSTSSCTVNLTGDGVKTVYIRCQDIWGNKMSSSESVTYTLDSTPPISLSASNSSSSWTNAKPTVTVSSPSDSLSGLKEIRYVWNNNTLGASCNSGTLVSSGTDLTGTLAEGSNVLYLCASDLAGNVATWNGSYKWDNGNPIVNITSHVGIIYNSSTIPETIAGTASDAVSAVSSVAVAISDGFNYWTGVTFDSLTRVWLAVTGTVSWEYVFSPTSDGEYTIESRAIDSASNQATSSEISFNYDGTTPQITRVESVEATASTAVISWETNELSSTQLEYGTNTNVGLNTTTTVEIDTSPRVTEHSVSLSGLQSCTTYHYRVISRDSAGNTLTGSNKSFTTPTCPGAATVESETTETVTTSSGGTVQHSESGEVKLALTVPANFSNSDADFQIKRLEKSSVITITSTPTSTKSVIGDHVYQLDALVSATEKADSFNEPITVTMSYTTEQIVGYNEASLVIYRWNGASWYQLSNCSVDTEAKTVSCETSEFSTFALFGEGSTSSLALNISVENNSQPEVCGKVSPSGSRPWLYGAIPQPDRSIKLYFTDASGPLTHYSLEYGTKPGVYQYGNLNIGARGDGYKQYTVSNLRPNTRYYFRVKAVNDCAGGLWSDIKEASTVINNISLEQEETISSVCKVYEVKSGDTLWKIAEVEFGDPYLYGDLIASNQQQYPSLLTSPGSIEVGWLLKLGCEDQIEVSSDLNQQEGDSDDGYTQPEIKKVNLFTKWYQAIWSMLREFFSRLRFW